MDASDRGRTADRIFRGALVFNTALTIFWGIMLVTLASADAANTAYIHRILCGE
jgi:hypothetical protein